MKKIDAIALAGSPTGLAKLLGITAGAITQWGEDVPKARIWQLQVIRPAWFKAAQKNKPTPQTTEVTHA